MKRYAAIESPWLVAAFSLKFGVVNTQQHTIPGF